MSLTRTLFRAPFARRTIIASPTLTRPFSSTIPVLATQDYGSGAGDPKAEDPQNQGTSKPTRDIEHPGPSSPAGNKDGGASSSSTQKSGGGGGGEAKGKAGAAAQPKIHNPTPPSEENGDVKKHNEEMGNRHDKAHEKSDEQKVGKDFWKGTGGVDRQS